MGRAPCCAKVGLRRGPWTTKEDALLRKYIQVHGEGNWRSLPKKAGLLRCGKSCRLRWLNYLRPDIKRGNITPDEDDLIMKMHSLLGNRWSLIAGRLPGRTDNEIKNYWNTHLSKKLRIQGTDPNTHQKMPDPNVKEPKKRRVTSSNKKQKKMVNKSKSKAETEKLKVHNPKPIRISSLSSFHILSRNSSSSDWSHEGDYHDKGLFGTEDHVDIPWSSFKEEDDNDICHGIEVDFLIGDDDDHRYHDIVGGCSELESHPSMSENNLEKLYEEYLQLLNTEDDQVQLDSFDDLINNNNNNNNN